MAGEGMVDVEEVKISFLEFLKGSEEFAEKVKKIGGRAYLVGGCVRDWKAGIEYPGDYDLMVTGLTRNGFKNEFPSSYLVGDEEDGFPVFLVDINGMSCEVAFARKEKKVANGYKGFETYTDPKLTVYDDLVRRDLTINSMAVDISTGEFIDPYGGVQHLNERRIKHVSESFKEDPLRVLRAARFAAQFGFNIDKETLVLMESLRKELKSFKPERIFVETKKALSGKQPSKYFCALKEAGVLDIHYPEINNLVGVPQPQKFHPEGDCFVHTMLVLDQMSLMTNRSELRFAALVHDLGKADSPALWEKDAKKNPFESHYGHEELGIPHVKALCKRLKLPNKWCRAGAFAAEYHGKMHKLGEINQTKSLRKIIKMIEDSNRNPIGVEGMAMIALADARGKGNPSEQHPFTDFWLSVAKEVLSVKANATLPFNEIADEKILRQVLKYREVKKRFEEEDIS
jgi:tRNA nucleotidyltransferase (CCA-adding enzyme)